MEYRVEELAASAGVRVDTIRFYQSEGLLPAPRREGRVAWYGEDHLERLRRIRTLKAQRFTLAQIRQVLARPEREPLLEALVEESVGSRTLSRTELASEAGVPEALIQAAVTAGLLEPVEIEGEARFSEADLEMARSGLSILEAGFPLQQLLPLAMRHHASIQELCEAAIDLFDVHVRKRAEGQPDAAVVTAVFQELLPQVTRLVARHFQRTLVNRAIARLERSQDREALAAAVAATESARLEVSWR